MRSLLALFTLLAALCARAPAADLSFTRVWLQWRKADSFQSLYEYRTARELTGKWVMLRSQPDERTGLYFLVRVENPGAPVSGAVFFVRVVTPEAKETKVFTFPADVRAGSWVFGIGLTGKDWAGEHVQPVAWEVELQSADGVVLARKTSFLWEKPGR
jgi:hypothetical protein